jgi:hypothetical protein
MPDDQLFECEYEYYDGSLCGEATRFATRTIGTRKGRNVPAFVVVMVEEEEDGKIYSRPALLCNHHAHAVTAEANESGLYVPRVRVADLWRPLIRDGRHWLGHRFNRLAGDEHARTDRVVFECEVRRSDVCRRTPFGTTDPNMLMVVPGRGKVRAMRVVLDRETAEDGLVLAVPRLVCARCHAEMRTEEGRQIPSIPAARLACQDYMAGRAEQEPEELESTGTDG